MTRSFTLQVGTHSNWVGSHYWSALEHQHDMSPENIAELYNETNHGVFRPRLFLVDTVDALGPSPTIDRHVESPEGFTVTRVDQSDLSSESAPSLHPFRESIIAGNEIHDMDYQSFNYWTDYWENPILPEYKKLIPAQNTFWYESRETDYDETCLRQLIEATDSSIGILRMIASSNTSMARDSASLIDYMTNCYSKTNILILGQNAVSIDHHPDQVHVATINSIHLMTELISNYNDWQMCIAPEKSSNLIEQSGVESIWFDSFSPISFDNRIEPCYLSIDSEVILGGSIGSIPHRLADVDQKLHSIPPRKGPYTCNLANPTNITLQSQIRAGTGSESDLVPLLRESIPIIKRFMRESKNIETEIFSEEIEIINALINRLIGDVDEAEDEEQE